jgi:hypothetical protein
VVRVARVTVAGRDGGAGRDAGAGQLKTARVGKGTPDGKVRRRRRVRGSVRPGPERGGPSLDFGPVPSDEFIDEFPRFTGREGVEAGAGDVARAEDPSGGLYPDQEAAQSAWDPAEADPAAGWPEPEEDAMGVGWTGDDGYDPSPGRSDYSRSRDENEWIEVAAYDPSPGATPGGHGDEHADPFVSHTTIRGEATGGAGPDGRYSPVREHAHGDGPAGMDPEDGEGGQGRWWMDLGPARTDDEAETQVDVVCNRCGEVLETYTRVCTRCGHDLYRHDAGTGDRPDEEGGRSDMMDGRYGPPRSGVEVDPWFAGTGPGAVEAGDGEDDISWDTPLIITHRPEIPFMQGAATLALMGIFVLAHMLRPEVWHVMGEFSEWVAPQSPPLAAVLAAAAGFFFVSFPRLDLPVQTTVKRSALLIFLLALFLPPTIIYAATGSHYVAGASLSTNFWMLCRMLLVMAYWAPVTLGVFGIWSRRPAWVGASALFLLAVPAFSNVMVLVQGGTLHGAPGEVGSYLAFALLLFVYTELADGSHRFLLLAEPRDGTGTPPAMQLHHLTRLLQRYFTFMMLFILMCAMVVFFVLNLVPLALVLGSPQVAESIELGSVFGTVLMFIVLGIGLFIAACFIRYVADLRDAWGGAAGWARGLGERITGGGPRGGEPAGRKAAEPAEAKRAPGS